MVVLHMEVLCIATMMHAYCTRCACNVGASHMKCNTLTLYCPAHSLVAVDVQLLFAVVALPAGDVAGYCHTVPHLEQLHLGPHLLH